MTKSRHYEAPYEGWTSEWLTPPEIIFNLGPFDLDPCASVSQPWDTAKTMYTIEDNGLTSPWKGRTWLNPPYGPHTKTWLQKLVEHNNGIALVFARTETKWFHELVWERASGLFFFKGRIAFYYPDGISAREKSRAPSVLVSYDQGSDLNSDSLRALEQDQILEGKYVDLRR